jgi:uncharacterized protein YybS (DUF2232 family)
MPGLAFEFYLGGHPLTQYNTRALVESALLAVIGMILVLLGKYVPLIGFIALLLWPLPSALVVLRHGMRWGVMASILTALCLTLFMNWITAFGLWVLFGLTGLTFGYAVTKQYSPAKIIVVTSIAFLIGTFSTFLFTYLLTGHTPMQLIDELLRAWQTSAELTERVLGTNPFVDMIQDFDTMKALLIRLLPSGLVLSALFQSYLNYEVLRRVLSRLGHNLEPLPPFSRWILPEYIAHATIISCMAAELGIRYNLPLVEQAGQSVFSALSLFLLIETASVISYYISKHDLPKFFSALAIFYVIANPVLNVLSVFFGIIDILFDVRQLRYGYLNDM